MVMTTITILVLLVSEPGLVRGRVQRSGQILGSQLTKMLPFTSAIPVKSRYFTLEPIVLECWKSALSGSIPKFSKVL